MARRVAFGSILCLVVIAAAQMPDPEIMQRAESLYSIAQNQQKQGLVDPAIDSLNGVLDLSAAQPQVYFELGFLYLRKNQMDLARTSWMSAVEHDPKFMTAYFNLGSLYAELQEYDNALDALQHALDLQPDSSSAYKSMGIIHQKKNDHEKAIENFMKCISNEPTNADCFCGMGNSFLRTGQVAEAHRSYKLAVNIDPTEPGYFNNVGNMLVRHHMLNQSAQLEALSYLNEAVSLDPNYAAAYFNLGNAYTNLKIFSKGLENMNIAVGIEPARTDYHCAISLTRRQSCDWENYDVSVGVIEKIWANGTVNGKARALLPRQSPPKAKRPDKMNDDRGSLESLCPQPLEALSLIISPMTVLSIAMSHAQHTRLNTKSFPPFPHLPLSLKKNFKIKIGYVSIELRDRPVGRDMVKALMDHPPDLIEIACFTLNSLKESLSEVLSDVWREKLAAVCTGGLFDISEMAYNEGAKFINSERVSTLINLDGWTSAPLINELCSLTPAPVQLNFKGYAGTTGGDWIDYLVSDRIATPPEMREYYVEHLLLHPHSYHYNGHLHLYPPHLRNDETLQRTDYGLTDSEFVFSNFNQFYKLTPGVFDAWLDILIQVPKSKLWMLAWNSEAIKNILATAARHGVSAERFLFSKPFPQDQHVAIKGLSDLFLDSAPYSAHGTAADALYAGVPLVTLAGPLMSSRVAASLLSSLGLDAYIARDLREYVKMAVKIASSSRCRNKLKKVRRSLREQAPFTSAFDSPRWVQNYVSGLRLSFDIFQNGVGRHHIIVSDENPTKFIDTGNSDENKISVGDVPPHFASTPETHKETQTSPPKFSRRAADLSPPISNQQPTENLKNKNQNIPLPKFTPPSNSPPKFKVPSPPRQATPKNSVGDFMEKANP